MPSLESSFFCLFGPIPMCLPYSIILLYYHLLEGYWFSSERQKGLSLDGSGSGEKPGRVDRGDCDQGTLCEKKIIFNFKREKYFFKQIHFSKDRFTISHL